MADSFGFNTGIKMGEFGFVQAVGTPTPPPVTPQPQYLVAQLYIYNEQDVETFTESINTLNFAHIQSVENIIDGGGVKRTRITFNQNFYSNLNNVYLEGRFRRWQNSDLNNSIPSFTLSASGYNTIDLTAISYDGSSSWAGYAGQFSIFTLTVIVFEP